MNGDLFDERPPNKREAALRTEMMARLNAWPSSPYCIPEPSTSEKSEFCEAFIAMSRPRVCPS